MQAVHAEPSSSLPVTVPRSKPTSLSDHLSHTEDAQGSSNRSECHFERITSPMLERNQLVASLNNDVNGLSDLGEDLCVDQVAKSAVVINFDWQIAKKYKLITGKNSLVHVISKKYRANEPDQEHFKKASIFGCGNLQYVGVCSKALSAFCVHCDREAADCYLFDAVEKRRWACRGESASQNGAVFSSGSILFPFSGDSNATYRKLYPPSLFSATEYLMTLIPQEHSNNSLSAMFLSAKVLPALFEAIALGRRSQAELGQFLSDEIGSEKRKSGDML